MTALSTSFTSPERLEDRIAPAGLITANFLNGILSIHGTDNADHEVHITKTGVDTFRVDGFDTGINDLLHTSKTFRGLLRQVRIDGGAGADTVEISNLDPLQSLTFHGDSGVDTLSTANLKTVLGGRVDIDLGPDTGSVNFFGSRTTVHGPLNIALGDGGAIGFRSAITTVDGHVAITGGLGRDSMAVAGDATTFKRNLTFTGGAGDDSFRASGGSFTVQGIVTMDGGPGSNHFDFAADHNVLGTSLKPGLVDLRLGVGPGSVSFGGISTNVLGDLKIDLGTGGGTAHLGSAANIVRDNLLVTGGAGNDALQFQGRTSIGKNLSFVGNVGDDSLSATGGLFAVKGATSMVGGSGASTFDLQVVSLALASLEISGGTVNDVVRIISDGTISGDADVLLGTDGVSGSKTILQSAAGVANGLKFGGALTIDMTGPTVDFLEIANIQVAKNFVAQTGEDVSTVDLARVNVLGNFKLQTGAGADVVNIDNVKARDFYVDTQAGADGLRIERNDDYAGQSRILGIATILSGIGADQIRIGNAIDAANLRVAFMGAMTLDTGDGPNMRNDVVGANFFEAIPKIISSGGGTLTQTEAV